MPVFLFYLCDFPENYRRNDLHDLVLRKLVGGFGSGCRLKRAKAAAFENINSTQIESFENARFEITAISAFNEY